MFSLLSVCTRRFAVRRVNCSVFGRSVVRLGSRECGLRRGRDGLGWQSPQAANKAFNITNGDVFEWRNLWPTLAETLGVKTGPGMPTSGAAFMTTLTA
jgi:hypothetical protein